MVKARKVKVGPERAKVWVVTVINPILEGMASEKYWLGEKNWSWRYRTGGFARIRYLPAYLDIRYMANYEDFCSQYATIKQLFEEHDSGLNDLAKALNHAYARLLELPELGQQFEAARKESPASGVDHDTAWGGVPQADCLKTVAEYVLNNISSLPTGYYTAAYWEKFGSRFLKLRDHQEIAPLVEKIEEEGARVAEVADRIEAKLKALRSEYATNFDIPPVPLEAMR